jgi:hypothetical protein
MSLSRPDALRLKARLTMQLPVRAVRVRLQVDTRLTHNPSLETAFSTRTSHD